MAGETLRPLAPSALVRLSPAHPRSATDGGRGRREREGEEGNGRRTRVDKDASILKKQL